MHVKLNFPRKRIQSLAQINDIAQQPSFHKKSNQSISMSTTNKESSSSSFKSKVDPFLLASPPKRMKISLEQIQQKFGHRIDFKNLSEQMHRMEMGHFKNNKINEKQIQQSNLNSILNLKKSSHLIQDQEAYSTIESLLLYTFELEKTILYDQNEITKLEYLNKYLCIGQQKRDDMIQHILEENRKLKETALFYERMKTTEKKKANNTYYAKNDKFKPMTAKKLTANELNFLDTNYQVKLNPGILTPQAQTQPKRVHMTMLQQELFEQQNQLIIVNDEKTKRKGDMRAGIELALNAPQLLIDSKKNILNINLSCENMENMYRENQSVQYVSDLLSNEKQFIDQIMNLDEQQAQVIFYNMSCFAADHKTLFSLVQRLKQTLKAANEMQESIMITEALNRIIEQSIIILECERASVFVLDVHKKQLWTQAAKGVDGTIRIPQDKGIVGHVCMTKEHLNILDAYSDKRFNPETDRIQNFKTKTVLCVPIIDLKTDSTIGVVQAINKKKGCFSKDDEGFLQILANMAGCTLKNSLKYDEQLNFHNSLRHVLRIGLQLSSATSTEHLLLTAEIKLKEFLTIDQARFFIADHQTNELIRYKDGKMERYPIDSGIAGKVYESGQFVSLKDSYSCLDFNGMLDIETTLPFLAFPIMTIENKRIGVFEAINPRGLEGLFNFKPLLSHLDQEVLEFFSQQLAQAIVKNEDFIKLLNLKQIQVKEDQT